MGLTLPQNENFLLYHCSAAEQSVYGMVVVDVVLTMRMDRNASISMMMTTYAPITIQTIAATGKDYNNNNNTLSLYSEKTAHSL